MTVSCIVSLGPTAISNDGLSILLSHTSRNFVMAPVEFYTVFRHHVQIYISLTEMKLENESFYYIKACC